MESGLPSAPKSPEQIFTALYTSIHKPAEPLPSHALDLLLGAEFSIDAQTDTLHIDHLTFSEDEALNTIRYNPDFWFDSYSDYLMPLTGAQNPAPARRSNTRNSLAGFVEFSTSNRMAQSKEPSFPPSENEKCDLGVGVEELQHYREAGRAKYRRYKNDDEDPINMGYPEEIYYVLDEDLFDGDEQISIGDEEDYDQSPKMIEDACGPNLAELEREIQNDEDGGTLREDTEAEKSSFIDDMSVWKYTCSKISHLGDGPAEWKEVGIPAHQKVFYKVMYLSAHSPNFAGANENKSEAENGGGLKGLVLYDQTAKYGGLAPPISRAPLPYKAGSVPLKPHYPNKQRPPTFDTGILKLASPLPQPAVPLTPSEREKMEESQRKPVKRLSS